MKLMSSGFFGKQREVEKLGKFAGIGKISQNEKAIWAKFKKLAKGKMLEMVLSGMGIAGKGITGNGITGKQVNTGKLLSKKPTGIIAGRLVYFSNEGIKMSYQFPE